MRKYDSRGNELWTREFSVPSGARLTLSAIAADATGFYVLGFDGTAACNHSFFRPKLVLLRWSDAIAGATLPGSPTSTLHSNIFRARKCHRRAPSPIKNVTAKSAEIGQIIGDNAPDNRCLGVAHSGLSGRCIGTRHVLTCSCQNNWSQ